MHNASEASIDNNQKEGIWARIIKLAIPIVEYIAGPVIS